VLLIDRPSGWVRLSPQRRREERAVMPAFGAYTGGLSIRDAAVSKIFQTLGFMAHALGDSRLHTIASSRCY
jgi:uncharacterized protein